MDNHNIKILLVDDEPDILEFLSYNLRREGYQVITAENGREGIRLAKEHLPQLILLDVMMPVMDGIETCNELRQDTSLQPTIIAFLTARNEDYSQISGFDAGADDYIAKPIKPKVLISRIKALLRRNIKNEDQPEGSNKIEVGGIVIDREKYQVINNGEKIILPRKEFELLALLASKPNKVFTRDEIFNTIWGSETIVGDRTIDVHIRKVREKLNLEAIKTIKGVGYKLEN